MSLSIQSTFESEAAGHVPATIESLSVPDGHASKLVICPSPEGEAPENSGQAVEFPPISHRTPGRHESDEAGYTSIKARLQEANPQIPLTAIDEAVEAMFEDVEELQQPTGDVDHGKPQVSEQPPPTADPDALAEPNGPHDNPEPATQTQAPVDAPLQQLATTSVALTYGPAESVLDAAVPLDRTEFPNPPRQRHAPPPSTRKNLEYLLEEHDVTAQYNVIKKKLMINIPGHSGSLDNFDATALTEIQSLARLNDLSANCVPDYLAAIGDKHQFNPVAIWIHKAPWDRVDRLQAFYVTLLQRADFPEELKRQLMYRWALSAVAAALKPRGFHSRGVLTLQGPQGIGKTAWARALVSDEALAQDVIKVDQHIDIADKDTVFTAVSHWIVEIGELDSTLRKDVARLKGFITAPSDKLRRPYGRLNSEYQRRTVFLATVNGEYFLVDSTGNTRWWTIPVIEIDYQHGIDMQQLFAQLAEDFARGEQWWLTKHEDAWLEELNMAHLCVNGLRERLMERLELQRLADPTIKALTATQVFSVIGIDRPSDAQYKDLVKVLTGLRVTSVTTHGSRKWRVPFKETNLSSPGYRSTAVEMDEDIPF